MYGIDRVKTKTNLHNISYWRFLYKFGKGHICLFTPFFTNRNFVKFILLFRQKKGGGFLIFLRSAYNKVYPSQGIYLTFLRSEPNVPVHLSQARYRQQSQP